ncbi:MAG: DoxX family protein [Sandaracinaceae bacterium]|nr:DoxX family protein [Sandaracinaceae bacterium]
MRRAKTVLRAVMGVLYIAAGVNHFVNQAFYVSIMPPYVPWHVAMVWISGVAEIALGIGVLVPKTRALAGWGLIALLIAVFPANLHMALAEPGTYDAPAWGLWLRLPVQALLIAWAWWATRPDRDETP